jgi:hypothetical protein
MVSYFITVSDGVITGVHSGDINADFSGTEYNGHERIEVPQNAAISAWDRVAYYGPGWKRKPDIQLIDEGVMPMPEGYVREEDNLRPMTREERIIAGLDEVPSGMKIENGKIILMTQVERIIAGLDEMPYGYKLVDNELIPMTLSELLTAGQITQADYEQALAAKNNSELQRRLAELQTPEALAQAEVDEDYAAERKAKLAALLAVKKQTGWPITVVWP